MNKQSKINLLQSSIRNEQARLRDRIVLLEKRYNKLRKIALGLDDPHALIPISYKTVEDWLEGHPFPYAVLANIYANYETAREVSLCCYTLQYEYHIVSCRPREYYINKNNLTKQ